jgi:hypothetical protein
MNDVSVEVRFDFVIVGTKELAHLDFFHQFKPIMNVGDFLVLVALDDVIPLRHDLQLVLFRTQTAAFIPVETETIIFPDSPYLVEPHGHLPPSEGTP